MKRAATILALSLASSAAFADDVEGDGAPVTQVTPAKTSPVASVLPTQTVWTVKPVVISLLRVLADPSPDPVAIRAMVANLAPEDVSKVVVAVAGNPSALAALVKELSAGQIAVAAVETMKNPSVFCAFIAKLTPAQIATVVVALERNPSAISALASTMTPEQLQSASVALSGNVQALKALASTMTADQAARVSIGLLDNPAALKTIVSTLNAEKLAAMRVELFLVDVEAWAKFADILGDSPAPAARRFGGTWLDAARDKLRAKIAKEGYSPAALAEAEAIMTRLKSAQ